MSGGTQRVLPPVLSYVNGQVIYPIDLSIYPFVGSASPITAGSGWSFQYAYRDPSANPQATWNLSDAQHIVFAP